MSLAPETSHLPSGLKATVALVASGNRSRTLSAGFRVPQDNAQPVPGAGRHPLTVRTDGNPRHCGLSRQPHGLRSLVQCDHVSFVTTNRCQIASGPIQTSRSFSSQIRHLLRRTNLHMKPTLFAESLNRPAINAILHACQHARSIGVKHDGRISALHLAALHTERPIARPWLCPTTGLRLDRMRATADYRG